jgi:hypothetical protein
VLVEIAASKKAVMHHAQAKQIKGDCQDNQKQDPSDSEPERSLSFRDFLIRILCHLSYLSAKSSDCLNTTVAPRAGCSVAVICPPVSN